MWTFIALDHCCKMQLLMDATESRPVEIDPEFAEYSHRHLGNSFISWLHFQTMLYEINEQEPDYLD